MLGSARVWGWLASPSRWAFQACRPRQPIPSPTFYTNVCPCPPPPKILAGGREANHEWCTHTDIEEVGHRAHLYAELAGRIEANFNDVRLTFDELGLNLRELSHYSATLDETPFPKGTRAHPLHTPIPLGLMC